MFFIRWLDRVADEAIRLRRGTSALPARASEATSARPMASFAPGGCEKIAHALTHGLGLILEFRGARPAGYFREPARERLAYYFCCFSGVLACATLLLAFYAASTLYRQRQGGQGGGIFSTGSTGRRPSC